MSVYYIGVDLGGTKILTGIADRSGKLLARKKLPTEAAEGTDKIIENIDNSINAVLAKTDITRAAVSRIAVGSPGPLSVRKGIIYSNSNLPWKNVPLVRLLQKKTGLEVCLENDANAAALGEKYFGGGQEADNLLYITISTGIGCGIIIDGSIFHGAGDAAGEAGHITIMPDGPLCGCGNYGCFEALASGTAIAHRGREAVLNNRSRELKNLCRDEIELIDARMVAKAAYNGDQMAKEIFTKTGYYLGIGLANLINLFNPELILFGGGVIRARDLFWESMKESLKARVLTSSYRDLEMKNAELGDKTGLMGAVAVAMERDR